MKQRIGLKHLAERLGMDVSTVSRALRGDPRVKAETLDTVQALAREMGYRPNAAAQALRGGATGRVAVLLSPPQQRFASPIFLELLSTLDGHLRGTGRTLAVFAAQDRAEEPAIVRAIVEGGQADGLILGRTRQRDPRVAWLLEAGFPFVTFGQTDWPGRHPWVDIDYARAGEIAVAALGDAGGAPLHVVSAPEGLRFADNYVAGARAEAARRALRPPQVQRVEMTEAAGEAAADAILARGQPCAIACIQDSLAFGVFRAAARAGAVVGRDVALFGGQNFPGSEHTAPPLSTFSTEDGRVADLLSRVMLNRLAPGGAAGPFETHVMQPRPLPRGSHRLGGG